MAEIKYLRNRLSATLESLDELDKRVCGVAETLSMIDTERKNALYNQTASLREISAGMHTLMNNLQTDMANYWHVQNEEPPESANSAPIDSEARLRMIAEAVSGMSNKEWSDASHKISRLFSYPATVASNRVTIGRTPDELMDILRKNW